MADNTARRGRKRDAASKSGNIRELLKTGMTAVEIAKGVGCTPALVYNVRARLDGTPERARGAHARPASLDGFASILDAVKGTERQRTELRTAQERIQSMVAAALA